MLVKCSSVCQRAKPYFRTQAAQEGPPPHLPMMSSIPQRRALLYQGPTISSGQRRFLCKGSVAPFCKSAFTVNIGTAASSRRKARFSAEVCAEVAVSKNNWTITKFFFPLQFWSSEWPWLISAVHTENKMAILMSSRANKMPHPVEMQIPFLLTPCSLPTYLPPSLLQKMRKKKKSRRPLAERADVCTKEKSVACTLIAQERIPSLGSRCPPAEPQEVSAWPTLARQEETLAVALGSPSFPEPSFFHLWKANHSICTLQGC